MKDGDNIGSSFKSALLKFQIVFEYKRVIMIHY